LFFAGGRERDACFILYLVREGCDTLEHHLYFSLLEFMLVIGPERCLDLASCYLGWMWGAGPWWFGMFSPLGFLPVIAYFWHPISMPSFRAWLIDYLFWGVWGILYASLYLEFCQVILIDDILSRILFRIWI